MRITKIIISAAISLLMVISSAGCGQKHELLYDPNAETEETTTSSANSNDNAGEIADPDNNISSTEDEPPFVNPDSKSPLLDSLRNIWGTAGVSDGGLMCFTEPTSGTEIPLRLKFNEYSIPMNDGTIEMDLNLITYSSKTSDQDVTGILTFFWNGEPYDFSVGGNESENGVLKVDMKFFENIIEPFKAEDLPVKEGKNIFSFCFIPYCAEKNEYLCPQYFTAYYKSADEREGCTPCPMASEKDIDPENITIVTNKSEALYIKDISESSYVSNQWNGDQRSFSVRKDTIFYINAQNSEKATGPSNRSGVLIFVVDGELQPVWNGNIFAYAELSDKEYKKVFTVNTNFQVGEEHDVLLGYAEFEDDKSTFGPMFQNFTLHCKIVE